MDLKQIQVDPHFYALQTFKFNRLYIKIVFFSLKKSLKFKFIKTNFYLVNK